MKSLLDANPRLGRAVTLSGSVLLVLFITQFVFKGGTPIGVMYDGLASGLLASLTAAGLVLVYRSVRIINFAQIAFGIFGVFMLWLLVRLTPVPFILAFPIGLVTAGLVGGVAGVTSLRFLKASRLVLTVATAITALFLVQFGPQVAGLPFFKDVSTFGIVERAGGVSFAEYLPFAGWQYTIGSSPVAFGFAHAFAIEVSVFFLAIVGLVLRYTKVGVAVRAMSENPERAGLLGINVPYLVVGVFVASGLLGGVTAMGSAMLATPSAGTGLSPGILLAALAGAVIARMERLPTAVIVTLLLEMFVRAFRFTYPEDQNLIAMVYLVVLAVGLLTQARNNDRIEQAEVSWAAAEEPRRIPAVLAGLGVVRAARGVALAVGIIALAVVPFTASIGFVNLLSTILISGIIVVSLVILTGWGGQVSLAQWAFAAFGAVVSGALTATVGVPFWIAVPVASAVAGAIAVLVGIPALRIRGLFLLPVSLAFAFATRNILFDERYFGWLLPDKPIERPTLFFLDFEDDTSMYFLCIFAFVSAIVVVNNLRNSRTGRILIALRDNETNVQSFGINVVRTKLLAFAISGAISGFAGAVFVHQQRGLSPDSFGVVQSLVAFQAVVIGGVASVAGALLGTFYLQGLQYFLGEGILRTFLDNGGTLIILFAYPGGLISLVHAGRDSMLRIIAQREQIVVPSLFADYDADALARQVTPLAAVDPQSGLAALPTGSSWSLESELYRGSGRTAAERFAAAARPETEREKAAAGQTNPLLGGAS
jgi:branched-chain amino acid transport system permease protein